MNLRHYVSLTLLLIAVEFSPQAALTQTASWTGQAQCVITVQGPGYSHQETQTWTVLGGTPTIQGAFRIYPGTWSVSGGGSLNRGTATQTLQAQWTTNGSVANAPVAVFVRASDNHVILKSWHAQLGVPGGTRGTQQLFINGVPQTPGPLSTEVFEYQFPAGEDISTKQTLSGSTTVTPNGSVSPMAPAGMQAKASCTWQYSFGASTPPVQTGSNPDNPGMQGTNPTGGNQGGSGQTTTNPTGSTPTGSGQTGSNPTGTNSGSNSGGLSPLGPLQVTQISPATAQQGQNLSVTLTGQGFAPGLCAFFGLGINGGACIPASILSPTSATVSIQIDPNFPPAVHNLGFAKSPPTGEIPTFDFSMPNGFTVTRSPNSTTPDLQLVGISPNSGKQGETVTIVLTGKAFASGMVANFGDGLSNANDPNPSPNLQGNTPLTITSPTTATATVKINAQAAPGPRNIGITLPTPAGPYYVSASLTNAFTVNPAQQVNVPGGGNRAPTKSVTACPAVPDPPPAVVATPYCVRQGQQNVTIVLNYDDYNSSWPEGTYNPDSFSHDGVTVKSVTWNSPLNLTLVADISPTAKLGPHNDFAALTPTTGPGAGGCCLILQVTAPYVVIPAAPANPLTSSAGTTSGGSGQQPTLTSVSPTQIELTPGLAGRNVTVTGKGTHFVQGLTTLDLGPGTGVNNYRALKVDSPQQVTATASFYDYTQLGPRTVTVTTGSEVVKLENAFSFVAPQAPPPPPPSGKYRIMLNGFHVNHETYDDILNADGQHDEVYASASLELVDHNLNRLQPGPVYVRTAVHGDINQAPNRVQAGSAVSLTGSRTGGLTNGDSVPNGSNPATYTGTLSYPTDPKPTFPFVLWEGTMTKGTEALIVQPMLWEFDGNPSGYTFWSSDTEGYAGAPYYHPLITQKIDAADLTPLDGGTMGIYCVNYPITFDPTNRCAPGFDRPIGIQDNGYANASVFVFTQEAIEKILSSTYSTGGMPPGVIRLSFVEAPSNWGGNYDLYIKVERIP